MCGTAAGSVWHIDATTASANYQAKIVTQSHCSGINAVTFSRESSERFCTATKTGEIIVWSMNNYRVLCRIAVPNVQATCATLSEDVVLVGFSDGIIRAFDPETGERLWKIPNAHKDGVSSIELASNHKFIVSGGKNGELRVWDVRTKAMVCHLKEHTQKVNKLKLYDSNKFVLSCSRDKSFLCWDLMAEKRITSHSQVKGGINSITLTGDQKSVITVGQERCVSVWNLRAPRPVKQWSADGEMCCVAAASTLPLAATAGVNRLVMLWDLSTGKCVGKGVGHSGRITDLAFSPDDQQLVSVAEDGTIMIWNIYTGL